MGGKELIPRPAVQPPVPTTPPWQQDKPELVPAYRWLWRQRHWTAPLFLLPALWLAGVALHVFHLAGVTLGAGAVLAVLVAAGAHLKWDRAAEQWYARLTAVLGAAWLWLAAWLGPLYPPRSLPWLSAALAAGVTVWGSFWWRHKRPRGHRRRQKRTARWDAWWQSHCWHWNLGGSKVAEVWEMGVTTKVRVHGIAGRHSIQHVRQVMHLVESGLEGHADIGMVRAEPVKGHPNWFDLFLKRENPLREIAAYDPALAPLSVSEPVPVGVTETGAIKTVSGRVNSFVIGMTRWGKSNLLSVKLASYTGCSDDRTILIDIGGGRSSRPWLAALDYVATSIEEARQVLRMLTAEVEARRKGAYFGEEQLTPTPDVPAIHLLVDETHALTSVANGDAECARLLALIASQGSAVAVHVEVYTQHGSLEESVRTEQTRANLLLRIVFRVAEARHGAYAIPEYTKLDASKLEEKGTCYIKEGKDALPEQVRTYHMPHDLVRRIASQPQNSALGRPRLALYASDWQPWWDTRWSRLDPAFQESSPQYQATVARSPAEAFATAPSPGAETPSPAPAPGEGGARAAAARIEAELAEAHRSVPAGFRPPKVNLTPVITQQKDAFATALADAPPSGISPAQLMKESGMGRTWIHQMLGALMETGAVTQIGRGLYAPVAGEGIQEAMAAIKAGNDQLYREARATVSSAA